jgi:hypothetical protein
MFGVRHPFGAGLGSAEISRRDILNGFLLASGGIAVSQSIPMRVLAAEMNGGACDGVIGSDPRVLRGGNLPSAFNVAHWMRDRRLRFESSAVTLAPGCDAFEGNFSISDDAENFDVIIVGTGLAGLSAAFYLLRRRAGTRILLLDANHYAGGNAGRDDGAPLPVPASTAGAYCCHTPYLDFLPEFYREMKIDWTQYSIPDPSDCYYFDEYTPGVKRGYRGWNIDTLDNGLKLVPYEKHVVDDLLRSAEDINAWEKTRIGLQDPPDGSSDQNDYLSEMTLDHYLTEVLHCDPIVSDFYTLYTIDALGGTTRQVNAHSALNFLAGEFSDDLFTFPGGTSEVARRLMAWLTSSGRIKSPRIQLNSVALRIDIGASASQPNPSVVYFKDQNFHRSTAKTVIVAAQANSARHLVEHLVDGARKAAWDKFNTVPVVVANVALRSAAPLAELGLGYSQAWWGSRYWANFSVADWVTDRRKTSNRPTVLTFFGGNTAPPEDLPNERMKLLQTPFGEYEKSIKDDLSRIMRGSKFDFDRDVSAIFLYRWGHSMIMPTPNWVFGNVRGAGGRLDRTKAPRHVACSPLGPISFAGQHTEGTPSVESAIASGHRAALEILARL